MRLSTRALSSAILLVCACDARDPVAPGAAVEKSPSLGISTLSLTPRFTVGAADPPSVAWNRTNGAAVLWKMSGTNATGETTSPITLASPWRLGATGDVNRDGSPDLIYENTSDGRRLVVFMNGTAFSGSYQLITTYAKEWRIGGAADFDADGNVDLAMENMSTGQHMIMYLSGSTFSGRTAASLQLATTYALAAVGDLNADSKPDFIFERNDGVRIVVFLNGAAMSGYSVLGMLASEWKIGGAADFNGDGQLDLATYKADGTARLYPIAGGAIQSAFVQLPPSSAGDRIAATPSVHWPASNVGTGGDVAWLRAAIINAAPGSTVNIPAGVYDVGNTSIKIEGKSNVQILGAGRGQTIIRGGSGAEFIMELVGANTNLTVAHLTIEGATTITVNSHGLASGYSRYSLSGGRFFDLEVKNVAVGISVVASGTGFCTDVQITGNYLDNIQDFMHNGVTSGSGYGIHNEGCTQVRIADNVVSNADRHAIYQAMGYQPDRPGPGSIVIEHNLIIDHAKTSSLNSDWLVAIVVARSANVVVAHNVIVNPYHDAISIEDPPGEGRSYVVNNVRLIDNTVLGSRGADVFLTAAGTFTSWGNRFFHGDASGVPSSPFVRKDGNGFSGNLAEPGAFAGTQAISAVSPFSTVYAMQANKLSSTLTAYNTDPSSWARTASPYVWSGFEDMTSSATYLYVMANRRLIEIDPITQAYRVAAAVFPARSMVSFVDGNLLAISGGQFYRVNTGSLATSAVAAPGGGTVRGVAAFNGKYYVYAGSCFYAMTASTLASTTIGC